MSQALADLRPQQFVARFGDTPDVVVFDSQHLGGLEYFREEFPYALLLERRSHGEPGGSTSPENSSAVSGKGVGGGGFRPLASAEDSRKLTPATASTINRILVFIHPVR